VKPPRRPRRRLVWRVLAFGLTAVTLASLGVITAPPRAAAATRQICLNETVPNGWTVIDEPVIAPSCPQSRGRIIEDFLNKPEGFLIDRCAGQPDLFRNVPETAGYVIISSRWDSTRCGDPTAIVRNIIRVKLPHPNDNNGLAVCRMSRWFDDWLIRDLGNSVRDDCTDSPSVARARILFRHSVVNVGGVLVVCNQNIPLGWRLERRFTDPARCNEFGGSAENNMMVIVKVDGEPHELDYAAMGDSFSSGQGSPPYTNFACRRSDRAWPQQITNDARRRFTVDFDFVACGGKTTAHVRDSQIFALTRETEVVTISIGGNNLGFETLVKNCTIWPLYECTRDVITPARFAALGAELTALYRLIDGLISPTGEVIVMMYPRIFPLTENRGCLPFTSAAEISHINNLWIQMEATVRLAATAAGVTYVNLIDLFAGHSMCDPDPWANRLSGGLMFYMSSFHPNFRGEQAVANEIVRRGHVPVRRY